MAGQDKIALLSPFDSVLYLPQKERVVNPIYYSKRKNASPLPTPGFFKFYEDSKIDGGMVGPLGVIHWQLPLSENRIVCDPTAEPLMIKAERSNLQHNAA
jgi:hypothetical protein